jgi:hypothetical protein
MDEQINQTKPNQTMVRPDGGPVTIPTTQSLLLPHRCAVACHISDIKAQLHLYEFDEHKRMAINRGVTLGGGPIDPPICFQPKGIFLAIELNMDK